jgi:hypothetical protein
MSFINDSHTVSALICDFAGIYMVSTLVARGGIFSLSGKKGPRSILGLLMPCVCVCVCVLLRAAPDAMLRIAAPAYCIHHFIRQLCTKYYSRLNGFQVRLNAVNDIFSHGCEDTRGCH